MRMVPPPLLPTPPPAALVAATADYTASPIPGIFHCRHHRRALAVSERCVSPSDYVTRPMVLHSELFGYGFVSCVLAARRVPTDRFTDGVPGAGQQPSVGCS